MKTQNRNGILGLETAKAVMVTFLVLAVIGIATILCLTALNDGVGDTVDNEARTLTTTATNETGAYVNATGYTLSGYNTTWSSITATGVWNYSDGFVIVASNYTLSSVGVLTNATTDTFDPVNLSYTYVHSYTEDTAKVDSMVGNVTDGLVTFFGSTGTIFSILIVVVIILAISIIIWAVGRFGQQAENQSIDL